VDVAGLECWRGAWWKGHCVMCLDLMHILDEAGCIIEEFEHPSHEMDRRTPAARAKDIKDYARRALARRNLYEEQGGRLRPRERWLHQMGRPAIPAGAAAWVSVQTPAGPYLALLGGDTEPGVLLQDDTSQHSVDGVTGSGQDNTGQGRPGAGPGTTSGTGEAPMSESCHDQTFDSTAASSTNGTGRQPRPSEYSGWTSPTMFHC
jgi:hypothetical protein